MEFVKRQIYGGQKFFSYNKIYNNFRFTSKGDGQLVYDLAECGLCTASYGTVELWRYVVKPRKISNACFIFTTS